MIDHHADALDTWTRSHRFEFEAFVCKDDLRESDKPAPSTTTSGSESTQVVPQPTKTKEPPKQAETKFSADAPVLEHLSSEILVRASTSQLIEELKQTEADFRSSSEPMDAPARAEMWHRLGRLNSQLKHQVDATICWSNMLWHEGKFNSANTQEWLQAELISAGRTEIDIQTIRAIVSSADSQARNASLVAAYIARAVAQQQGLAELQAMVPQLTHYFEQQGRSLPVRVVWLTALCMHELVGGDALGLARVRDRLLERLFQNGLMGEFDIVSFLRGSSQYQSDQHRVLRANWLQLMNLVEKWVADHIVYLNKTQSYIKLVFAYSLVRIGEIISGRELLGQATEELAAKDAIHLWMSLAFNYRIEQAAQGGNNREPLPEDLVRQLESMDRLDRYKIDRLRQHSRVLEPHDRIDAYRRWNRRYTDDLYQTLAELKDLTDLTKVAARLVHLLGQHTQGQRGLRVLASALEFAPRLGDEFATALLTRVDPLLAECPDVIEKTLLIERSLNVAAHFGHTARVNALIERLRNELPAIVTSYLQLTAQFNPADKERIATVENLLQFSFRGLRKLGMREELAALYTHIANLVEQHAVKASPSAKEPQPASDAQLSRRCLCCCV